MRGVEHALYLLYSRGLLNPIIIAEQHISYMILGELVKLLLGIVFSYVWKFCCESKCLTVPFMALNER